MIHVHDSNLDIVGLINIICMNLSGINFNACVATYIIAVFIVSDFHLGHLRHLRSSAKTNVTMHEHFERR